MRHFPADPNAEPGNPEFGTTETGTVAPPPETAPPLSFPLNKKFPIEPALARAWVEMRRNQGDRFAHGFQPTLITELSALALADLLAHIFVTRARAGLETVRPFLLARGFTEDMLAAIGPHAEALAVARMVPAPGAGAPVQSNCPVDDAALAIEPEAA